MVKHNILDLSFSKVPMLKVLLPYILGIGTGKCFLLPKFSLTLFLSILGLYLIGILFLLLRQKSHSWKKPLVTTLYALFFATLGYGLTNKDNPQVQSQHFAHIDATHYVGMIADEPIIRERSVRFPLRLMAAHSNGKTVKATGNLMVTLARDSLTTPLLRYGDHLAIKSKFQPVHPPFNPGEFDYQSYLQNKNIWHQCYLRIDDYILLSTGKGNPIIHYSLVLRETLIDKFSIFMQHAEAFQVAIALIFGYRSQIDAATLQAFSNTGTIHVLSVSGLHVGLVFALLTFILKWIDRFRFGRVIRCVVIGLAVWIYVILTGMAPPILRAGIMISFFLVSTATRRKQAALNTLAASAFFILLFNPKAIFDVGFQLSYMAMLGIFLLYPLMSHLYLPTNKYGRTIVAYCYVSIAAQLFTLPFVLYYFGQFPNYFLLANLFIAIPSTLVMYLGLALACSPLDYVSIVLGIALDFLLDFCLAGLKWIGSLPYAVIQGIDWSVLLLILCSLFIAALIIALNNTNRRMLLASMMLLFAMSAIITHHKISKSSYSGWRLYNVRQALALARIHHGEVVLYSTYDTLTHPNLLFSVLPDLLRYTTKEAIEFVHIPNEERQNVIVTIGDSRIAVVERPWKEVPSMQLDLIVWRKNNRASLAEISPQLKSDGVIVFDGSNSDKFLNTLFARPSDISKHSYILKNNFAYVWEENKK